MTNLPFETSGEVFKRLSDTEKRAESIVGKIISDAIWTENILNDIFVIFFIKKERQNLFANKIITMENFTARMKIELLRQSGIFKDKEVVEPIKKVFEIRNIVAHCYRGNWQGEILEHHRKGYLDLIQLKKEFEQNYKKVVGILVMIFNDLNKK